MPVGSDARRWRGRILRAIACGMCLAALGCATTEKPAGPAVLRPALQQAPTNQIVGDAIVASLGGAGVSLRWMDAEAIRDYFGSRPGLVSPWPEEMWKESPPTIFLVRIRNQARDDVQFDPAMVALTSQDGERDRPIPYEEMYMRLAEVEDAAPRLASLQATLLSRFLVIPPGGQREGLLLFPSVRPKVVHFLLDLASFFVGGRVFPGRFEFQVTR
jgi:hypothetical protein